MYKTKRHPGRRTATRLFSFLMFILILAALLGNCIIYTMDDTPELYEALQKDYAAAQDQISGLSIQLSEANESIEALQEQSEALQSEVEAFRNPPELTVATATIYNIPFSEELQEYTYRVCVDYDIPEYYELILAMMWKESHFTEDVISATNDYGLMQINKSNHTWISNLLGTTDFLDAKQNIQAGVYLISGLLTKYGDVHKALMCYNYGEGGAMSCWSAGTYQSSYSQAVVYRWELIRQDAYSENI